MRNGAIGAAFARCREQDRAALVPYVTAGHPSAGETGAVLDMLAESGADVIELGVPFSDPLADGPIIQHSSHTAILQGVDIRWTLDALATFRATQNTPVVLFTYLNPVLHLGVDRFLADASGAGADGVLVIDLPAGHDTEWERAIADSSLDLIRLVAPTTKAERARQTAECAQGFLYYVSRTGVTGVRSTLVSGLEDQVAALKAVSPVPVAVGFGISNAEQARRVAAIADGVVVGSAMVRALSDGGVAAAAELMTEIRPAMARPG